MLAGTTTTGTRNVFRSAATWPHRHGLDKLSVQNNRTLISVSSGVKPTRVVVCPGQQKHVWKGLGQESSSRFGSCGGPLFSRGLAVTSRQAANSTNAAPLRNQQDPEETQTNESNEQKDIPSDWWIEALERTANAPWLFHLPNTLEDRLKRAFTLIFQIMIYLGRPQEEQIALQFLTAFTTAVVPPESEIGRARRAVANITRAIVHDISSVPLTSPLRGEHSELFGIFDALRPLHDVYLENMREGDVDAREWNEFWTRAEPVLITLGGVLDQKGFGLEEEEEEERKASKMKTKGNDKEKNREK